MHTDKCTDLKGTKLHAFCPRNIACDPRLDKEMITVRFHSRGGLHPVADCSGPQFLATAVLF